MTSSHGRVLYGGSTIHRPTKNRAVSAPCKRLGIRLYKLEMNRAYSSCKTANMVTWTTHASHPQCTIKQIRISERTSVLRWYYTFTDDKGMHMIDVVAVRRT